MLPPPKGWSNLRFMKFKVFVVGILYHLFKDTFKLHELQRPRSISDHF